MSEKQEIKKKFKCKSCIFWKNGQQALNYHDHIGFCVNPAFKFNVQVGRLIGVYDDENERDKNVSGNPSHDFETLKEDLFGPEKSIYHLTTAEEFGCIYHKSR